MSTDEVAAYYSGRNRAAVAMSNAAKKAGIRKLHFELARRYADLADVSGSEIDPSQRQTALDVQVVQAALSFPRQTGEATFLTPSVACLTSDRLLAPGARGRCRASRAPQLAVKAPLHPEAATNLALAVIASSTAQLLLLDSDCTVIAGQRTVLPGLPARAHGRRRSSGSKTRKRRMVNTPAQCAAQGDRVRYCTR
jgi:hypothetical protein